MASRSERTPDYINTLVFITIDSSARLDEQTEPTNRNFEQPKILKPPAAQNLSTSRSHGKYEPPRAHNLIKFSIRTIDKGNGLKFDRNRSKSRNFGSPTTHLQSPGLNFDSSPSICQESHDSLQYPTLIRNGIRIRKSCC